MREILKNFGHGSGLLLPRPGAWVRKRVRHSILEENIHDSRPGHFQPPPLDLPLPLGQELRLFPPSLLYQFGTDDVMRIWGREIEREETNLDEGEENRREARRGREKIERTETDQPS